MNPLSVNQIVLRKNENFWIFPSDQMFNNQRLYSPWFSCMGQKWRFVKQNISTGYLKFFLYTKLRSNPSKYNYTLDLKLKCSCSCELISKTSHIDLDYGCELDFSYYCRCGQPIKHVYFQQNELVKVFFDIQKKEGVINITEINDGRTLNENEENGENGESSGNEENNGDEESDVDTASSNDEGPDETTGIDRLVHDLKSLLTNGQQSDVTLKVEDHEFKVHRNILIARSSVFASMLTHDTKENATGIVDIPDCSAEAFEVFLEYIYTGSASTMSSENIFDLYYVADKYQVNDLKSECKEYMEKTLSVENFCAVMTLSLEHCEPTLQKKATRFFCKNVKVIIKTVQWQQYVKDYPVQANELYIKAINA